MCPVITLLIADLLWPFRLFAIGFTGRGGRIKVKLTEWIEKSQIAIGWMGRLRDKNVQIAATPDLTATA